jgi:hypothetical protein
MPDAFLGDGLTFEELLPIAWVAGPLPEGLELARLNTDNHQLLGAEASLEEARVAEALAKEESPALLHELQRLEFKLNVLLRLVAELAARTSALPQPQAVRLGAQGLEWKGANAPQRGCGVVHIYINSALPQPVKIPGEVVGERLEDGERIAQVKFRGVSDSVADMLEKLIFRHHRRLIAGARMSTS